MNKGIVLTQHLVKVQEKKLPNQTVQLASYYPFATILPDEIDKEQKVILIKVKLCYDCGRDESENCGCNSGFETHIIKIQDGF